jgi:excinuclease ABC subunit A
MDRRVLAYYAAHSPITDPGPYAYLYNDLPDDLERLFQIINGVLCHKLDADDLYQPTAVQRKEQFLRTMQQRLARIVALDPSSLTVPRAMKEKQIGYCRDYAVFMTSILRHKGYAARTRAGFGEYFLWDPAYKGDHWVTEYWAVEQARWCLVDANIGGSDLAYLEEKVRFPLKPSLDFTDLRADDEFHLAPHAWLRCRSGEERIDLFRHNAGWRGWPMLRGNLLHDFQALNKLEMGLFDYWDDLHMKPESAMTAGDRALLDRIARVSQDPDATFDEMCTLFEELPRTRVIRSRLYLLGVLGEGQMALADDLGGSDTERLVALTAGQLSPAASPGAKVQADPARVGPRNQAAASLDASRGIIVLGARQNNLKNLDVYIPRNKLVVVTGVSGSGKSSLAFDTIYAEGQRRYMESLSSFARQFTRQMEKPQMDKVIGLNPAVAIEQRTISPNSRSTVGSLTELSDYLRLLFARLGRMHCPQCGRAVEPQSAQQIANHLVKLPPGTPFQILSPVNRYGRLTTSEVLIQAQEDGFPQARVDGVLLNLDSKVSQAQAPEPCQIELLVADLAVPAAANSQERSAFHNQVVSAMERAFEVGKGIAVLLVADDELRLSGENVCPSCALYLPRLEPRLLNPNTVFGMCQECHGLGLKLQVDPDRIITNPHRSLLDDASAFHMYRNLRRSSSQYWINYIRGIADYYGADLEKPWNELPQAFRRTLIHGSEEEIRIEFGTETETGSFSAQSTRQIQGAIHHINRLYRQTKSESSRRYYLQFMCQMPCPACNGERLNREARFVTLAGRRFPEVSDLSIGALLAWIRSLKPGLDEQQLQIGEELLTEIEERLQFICDVGLHYLSLDRPAPTLSGGEAQRIRLASQIGSEMVGVLYVLDEPSIGLHSRDQKALLGLLKHLRDLGNTVLVVEHDVETMRAADWLIDLGPGAGVLGGELVAAGTPQEIVAVPESLTGQYLAGELAVRAPNGDRLRAPQGWLTLTGARLHNLKRIDACFPLGTFICITGVSGSGKSSLITQTLSPALARRLHDPRDVPGPHDGLEGADQIDRVIHITQAPIGLNPRSNPGTYVGVWDEVRKVFAQTEQARAMGYGQSHFSFNTKGGRCEACKGYGANKVKMHFMADVWIRCRECEGKRFTPQVLEIRYRGVNIAEVLEMDVQQAFELFADQPRIRPLLQTLLDVGLGYVRLGQSAPTLSGGEAQRIKLARELSRSAGGHTLYILDEPTTGLHMADIQKLLDILHRLVDAGNTVMVVEHNLDVVKTADWVIDLGPEGGEEGGYIVAEGPPAEIAAVEASYTGQFLRQALELAAAAAVMTTQAGCPRTG